MAREKKVSGIKEQRDFIRSVIESKAKMLEDSEMVDYDIISCLAENKEDAELWKAALPYLSAFALGMYGASETICKAIADAIDGGYIWSKVKHLRPEVDNDIIGAVIGADLIERFVIVGRVYGAPTIKAQNEEKTAKATTKKAKEFTTEVTKIGGIIFDQNNATDVFGENGIAVKTGKKRGKPIQAFVTMSYDELREKGVDIPSWDKLTSYDREILSIVSSLYEAGNEYQSMDLIGRALAGNRKNEASLTPTQRECVINALRKLRSAQITIDSSQEFEANYNARVRYEGALLPSERIEKMELNGQKVRDCIHIFRASPLYEYAKSKNQIARVDIKMLDVPPHLTPEYIGLRGYLIRRILSMKSDRSNIRPVILYDTLYENLELETKGYRGHELRQKKKSVRDATKRMLEYWKEQGLINGFEEVSEGRKITKLNILL